MAELSQSTAVSGLPGVARSAIHRLTSAFGVPAAG